MFDFVACSGAETPNVSLSAITRNPKAPDFKYNKAGNTDWGGPDNGNQGGELPQDAQGELSKQTTLVTISIGDARFADIITGCVASLHACDGNEYHLRRHSTGAVDPKSLIKFEPIVIKLLQTHLISAYTAIHKAAPNAKIIVVGYPNLFPANPKTKCKVGPGIAGIGAYLSVSVQKWLNFTGLGLNSTIRKSVLTVRKRQKANIFFVNPTAAFADHELCSHEPWIYPIVIDQAGKSVSIDPASFHPTVAGRRIRCPCQYLPSPQQELLTEMGLTSSS